MKQFAEKMRGDHDPTLNALLSKYYMCSFKRSNNFVLDKFVVSRIKEEIAEYILRKAPDSAMYKC